MTEPGNYYATPELADAYDADCAGRRDLDFYLGLAAGLGAERVVDVGAGTGRLCSLLARHGHEVVGVEPEETMLSLAKCQQHADSVTWVHGTAEDGPSDWADLVLMTGHVAQYFLDHSAWASALAHAKRSLRSEGRLAFEVRNPAVEAWRDWPADGTRSTSRGTLRQEVRCESDLVTHIDHWTQGSDQWTTTETLRFPSWDNLLKGLDAAGWEVEQTWGDWDRSPVIPSCPEWIVLVRQV